MCKVVVKSVGDDVKSVEGESDNEGASANRRSGDEVESPNMLPR